MAAATEIAATTRARNAFRYRRLRRQLIPSPHDAGVGRGLERRATRKLPTRKNEPVSMRLDAWVRKRPPVPGPFLQRKRGRGLRHVPDLSSQCASKRLKLPMTPPGAPASLTASRRRINHAGRDAGAPGRGGNRCCLSDGAAKESGAAVRPSFEAMGRIRKDAGTHSKIFSPGAARIELLN